MMHTRQLCNLFSVKILSYGYFLPLIGTFRITPYSLKDIPALFICPIPEIKNSVDATALPYPIVLKTVLPLPSLGASSGI